MTFFGLFAQQCFPMGLPRSVRGAACAKGDKSGESGTDVDAILVIKRE